MNLSNFCHQPWVGLDIDQVGNIRPCCKFRNNLATDWENFNINSHSVDDYKNSNSLKLLKESFLQGEKPKPCIRCWQDEDAEYKSKRLLDFENWQSEFEHHDLDSDNTLLLTIPLGNICNLKCRICGPAASSSWIKEYRDLHNKKPVGTDWINNPSIWKDILKISETAIDIHLHGGEPFLFENDKHLQMLDTLSKSSSANKVKLHYNTNGTIFPSEKYWNYWRNFKWVDIQPSIDDMGKRFEYNRKNADWSIVEQNLLKYRDYIAKLDNMQLSISTTVSVFTIYYLDEFFDWVLRNNLPKPWLGKLYNPEYYRCNIFPQKFKNNIVEKLKNSNHEDLEKISSWLTDDESYRLEEFRKTVKLHDVYRKESFKEIFPEIYAWLF